MKGIAFIMYSHSDYSDVWDIFFKQTEAHLPEGSTKYIFTDKKLDNIPGDYKVVLYDDSLPYQERVGNWLMEVEEKLCIFQHEDMFLYSSADKEKLLEYASLLGNSNPAPLDFIKLIKGGEYRDIAIHPHKDLFHIPFDSEYVFAIQPTLWRTDKLREVYFGSGGDSIWDFEVKGSQYCRDHKIVGAYCYRGEPQRGMMHWDSKTFPYIATAIVKGKWNLSEYKQELGMILSSYKIDLGARGTC